MSLSKKAERLQRQEQEWQKEKEILEKQYSLQEDKKSFSEQHRRKKLTTSKKLIAFLFVNCTVIELFVLYITIRSITLAETVMTNPDFTPLVTLVGAIVSEVIGYAVYAIKSAKENCANGITYMKVQHELAAAQINPPQDENIPEDDGTPQG